jgi:putative transcriptional regulator
MKSNNIKPAQGKILISEPFLNDFYFKKSVVLLAEHNEEGSFGFIINKPIKIKASELLKDFADFEPKIYLGGPVKTDTIYAIHSLGKKIPDSKKIINGLYWGGNVEVIFELMSAKKINAEDISFYIGYSGWSANQLNNELNEKSWIVLNPTIEQILTKTPENLWSEKLKTMGSEYAIWANPPVSPSLN